MNRMNNSGLVVGIIMGGIGLACLIGAILIKPIIDAFVARAETASGTVIHLQPARTGRAPVVRFTVEGKPYTFTSPSASSPAAYYEGETVQVLYDPRAPGNGPRIKSLWGVWMPVGILLIGALIFGGIGQWALRDFIKEWRQRRWLRRKGMRVKARVTKIKMLESQEAFRQVRYQILSEWVNPAINLTQFFYSDEIDDDPTDQVGDEIEVLVDPDDDERYLVDLSFLKRAE